MSLSPAVPNPPGPLEVLSKTTSSIEIKWEEAPEMTMGLFEYRLFISSRQGVVQVPGNITNHTFASLRSGTPYNMSVLTVGPLDFESEKVQVNMVTTCKSFVPASQKHKKLK